MNGNRYDGNWENDKRYGRGTQSNSNGDEYVGVWKDDMRHGKGT